MYPMNNELGNAVLQTLNQLLVQYVQNNSITQYEGTTLSNSIQQNSALLDPVMQQLWSTCYQTNPLGVTQQIAPINLGYVQNSVSQFIINAVNKLRQYQQQQQQQQQQPFQGFGSFTNPNPQFGGTTIGGFNNFAAANQAFTTRANPFATSVGFPLNPPQQAASDATRELFGNNPITPPNLNDLYVEQQPIQSYETSSPVASTVEHLTRAGQTAKEKQHMDMLQRMAAVKPSAETGYNTVKDAVYDVPSAPMRTTEDIIQSDVYKAGLAMMDQDLSLPTYSTVEDTITEEPFEAVEKQEIMDTLSVRATYNDITRYRAQDTGIVSLMADVTLPGYFTSEEAMMEQLDNRTASHMRLSAYTQYGAVIHWNRIVPLPTPIEHVEHIFDSWMQQLRGRPCTSGVFLKEFLTDKRNMTLFDYISTTACQLFNSASRMNLTYPDTKFINNLCPVIGDIWAVPMLFMKDSSVIGEKLRDVLEQQTSFIPRLKTTIDAVIERFYPKHGKIFLDPEIEEDRRYLLTRESCGVMVNGKSGIELLHETDEDILYAIIKQLRKENVCMIQQMHTFDTNNPLPKKMLTMKKGQAQRVATPRNLYEALVHNAVKKYDIVSTTQQLLETGTLFHGTTLNGDLLSVCSAHLSYDC